jgi:rhodanese-related sulfurtransferase
MTAPEGEHDAIDSGTVELSAEDLRILLEIELKEDHPQLLDVRSNPAWKAAHIPGALNLPMESLDEKLDDLDTDRPVILYGESGTQSVDASYVLKKAGFSDVRSLAGGIDSWVGAGNEIGTID